MGLIKKNHKFKLEEIFFSLLEIYLKELFMFLSHHLTKS